MLRFFSRLVGLSLGLLWGLLVLFVVVVCVKEEALIVAASTDSVVIADLHLVLLARTETFFLLASQGDLGGYVWHRLVVDAFKGSHVPFGFMHLYNRKLKGFAEDLDSFVPIVHLTAIMAAGMLSALSAFTRSSPIRAL